MYSVRLTNKHHGSSNLVVLIYILIITAILYFVYGKNYLIIFCTSALLHLIIESGLAISGIRKGEVFAFGRKLPKGLEILLKSLVEGPAFCVPAFFAADQLTQGNVLIAVSGPLVVVGLASWFLGWSDKNGISTVQSEEEKLVSRRAMTKPKAVMLLALINTGCLAALFLMPKPQIEHAFTYLIAYSLLVMLFYLINYNFGVRFIEIYDGTGKYSRPGVLMQAAGLTYDSAYEMALLVSPAYWIAFYLGLFA